MTYFEELLMELGVEITKDENCFYTGMSKAVYFMLCDLIIFSKDESVKNLSWEEEKKIVADAFYKKFPYMKK